MVYQSTTGTAAHTIAIASQLYHEPEVLKKHWTRNTKVEKKARCKSTQAYFSVAGGTNARIRIFDTY